MPIPSHLAELRELEVQQALRNLRALPALKRSEVGDEDSCPVCLAPLESIFEEHDVAVGKLEGSSTSPRTIDDTCLSTSEMTGVVKLSGCGHVFCRKDLSEWIESHHGSCPACRRTFFMFTPIDEAEYESSDGGEYVPGEDDEDEVFSDDGDIDLVASSDLDPYRDSDSDNYRFYDGEEEDFDTDEEVVDRELAVGESEDTNELSCGSDAASSDGTSFTTEEDPETMITDVGMASGERNADEANELSSDIEIVEVKSPVISTPGSSNSSTNITQ